MSCRKIARFTEERSSGFGQGTLVDNAGIYRRELSHNRIEHPGVTLTENGRIRLAPHTCVVINASSPANLQSDLSYDADNAGHQIGIAVRLGDDTTADIIYSEWGTSSSTQDYAQSTIPLVNARSEIRTLLCFPFETFIEIRDWCGGKFTGDVRGLGAPVRNPDSNEVYAVVDIEL